MENVEKLTLAQEKLQPIRQFILKLYGRDVYDDLKCRKRDYVDMRMLYYKIAKEVTKYSLGRIGETLGKNHATVINSLRNWDSFGHQDYSDAFESGVRYFNNTDKNMYLPKEIKSYISELTEEIDELRDRLNIVTNNNDDVVNILAELKNKRSLPKILEKLRYMVMAQNNKQ